MTPRAAAKPATNPAPVEPTPVDPVQVRTDLVKSLLAALNIDPAQVTSITIKPGSIVTLTKDRAFRSVGLYSLLPKTTAKADTE